MSGVPKVAQTAAQFLVDVYIWILDSGHQERHGSLQIWTCSLAEIKQLCSEAVEQLLIGVIQLFRFWVDMEKVICSRGFDFISVGICLITSKM